MNENDPFRHLQSLLENQKAAFRREPADYPRRMQALKDLRNGLQARQDELVRAVSEDFGGRSQEETLALELFPLYDQIRHARKHLKSWMRRQKVSSAWFLLPSRAFVEYQPLGVVGVMGAWNYQFLLTLGPLVDALAAGNHVILKPSEVTPRSAEVIKTIISETFPPGYVTCVTGDAKLAEAFSALPFDHLFFTGSTRVGKLVMKAAAANLTPVTLELGSKSPAIIHASFPLALAVQRIITGKLYNAGQTCVAPDYVLLPEGMEDAFEELARQEVSRLYPRLTDNPDYTRIINQNHYQRLQSYVADATARGARVVALNPAGETAAGEAAAGEQATPDNKIFPPVLIFSPNEDMKVMQEETFGPVLPVLTYKTTEEAIEYINARPHPLALYYFDNNKSRVNKILKQTTSGGVTINDCIYHLAQHNLPFGGVGASGMGHYHGFDGFVTFSKKRGVMVQRRLASSSLLSAPFTGRKKALLDLLLRLARR